MPLNRADSTSPPAIVLAAGASTRLGRPKQLLRLPALNGETLLEHTIRAAREAGASPIIVVLGANAEQIERECPLSQSIVLHNPDWLEGMASSLRAGVSMVVKQLPKASGALLLVCDQPALTSEHLRRLLENHARQPEIVAASRYAGRVGVPAVVPGCMFADLLILTGDRGARGIFAKAKSGIDSIEFPGGEFDIDLPEDLERLSTAKFLRKAL